MSHHRNEGIEAPPGPTRSRGRLAWACLALLAAAPHAYAVTAPPVPAGLEVPSGHEPFRIEHAIGTQNFVCLRVGDDFAWTPFGPQATGFSREGRQTLTHFLGANPDEGGTARPTWQDSRDTSSVWARPIADSSDPAYVEPEAIPWLLLRVVGSERGPRGGRRLTRAAYLQRVNTSGGKAPTAGCSEDDHVGDKALVPYAADYVFYRKSGGRLEVER
jgi:hypothetical protein